MDFLVDGKKAYAYTAAHEIDAGRRTMVFVHGAGLDHSWWGLQSRYFGYHGWNVLADNLYAEVILYQGMGDAVKAIDRINKILTHAPLSPAAEKLREKAVLSDKAG